MNTEKQKPGSARMLLDLSTDGSDKTIIHGEINGSGIDLLYLLASLFEKSPGVLELLKDGISAHESFKVSQSKNLNNGKIGN